MSKKFFASLLLLGLVTLSASPALAVGSTSSKTPKSTANRDVAAASESGDSMDKTASKDAGKKAMLGEEAGSRIRELGGRMLDRMQAAITRLMSILDRIETRIAKIEAKNKKGTAALTLKVTKVKTQLQTAQTTLDQAKDALAALPESDNPKGDALQVKTQTGKVRTTLIQARKDMLDLLVALVKLEPKVASDAATATGEPEVNP